MKDILVTGVRNGLGKFLHTKLGGLGLSRETPNEIWNQIREHGVDAVIHCAANPLREVNSASLSTYLEDNVFLVHQLLAIPHKKFVYISSIDVYPKDGKGHAEDEIIPINSTLGIYAITKLMSESLVTKHGRNPLILRGSAFLGSDARKNSFLRILEDEEPELTLSSNSAFNYVHHIDIASFIETVCDRNLQGIYNLASSANILLAEVAEIIGKKVKFGNFCYDAGKIDNRKIASAFPVFRQTSKQVAERFILQYVAGKTNPEPVS